MSNKGDCLFSPKSGTFLTRSTHSTTRLRSYPDWHGPIRVPGLDAICGSRALARLDTDNGSARSQPAPHLTNLIQIPATSPRQPASPQFYRPVPTSSSCGCAWRFSSSRLCLRVASSPRCLPRCLLPPSTPDGSPPPMSLVLPDSLSSLPPSLRLPVPNPHPNPIRIW
jgi:hypothetical protein